MNHDYSAFGTSDMLERHVEKKTAEKLFLNHLEELTTATAVSFHNYQPTAEQGRRIERDREWEIGQLHQALGKLATHTAAKSAVSRNSFTKGT